MNMPVQFTKINEEQPDTALDELAARDRVRLEFGHTIREIAEIAKADINLGVNLYEAIQSALESRVTELVRKAYDDGVREGRGLGEINWETRLRSFGAI
jgi:hypothetical protein